MGKELRPCLLKGEDPGSPIGTPSSPLPISVVSLLLGLASGLSLQLPPLPSVQSEVEDGMAGQQRGSGEGTWPHPCRKRVFGGHMALWGPQNKE